MDPRRAGPTAIQARNSVRQRLAQGELRERLAGLPARTA